MELKDPSFDGKRRSTSVLRTVNKSQATEEIGDGNLEMLFDKIDDLQVQVDRLDGKMVEVRQDQLKIHGDPRVQI